MDAVKPLSRPTVADWLFRAATAPRGRVGSLVPTTFRAQARVLHRATGPDGAPARWAAVAAAVGSRLHPLVDFPSLAGRPAYDARDPLGWSGENPVRGSLDDEQLDALCLLLQQDTGAGAPCTLLVWDGWGTLPPAWRSSGDRVRQDGRDYLVLECPLRHIPDVSRELAGGLPWQVQSPALWWPADRSWCVATEVDLDSTVLAGSAALVARVLAHPELEAVAVRPLDDLTAPG